LKSQSKHRAFFQFQICHHLKAFAAGLILSLFGTALLAGQSTTSQASKIQDHLHRAAEALKANDPQTAIKEFDAVLSLDPKNAEAHSNRGAVMLLQGDCKTASQDFRAALAVDPRLAKARAMLGMCEQRLGQPDARELLESSFPKLKEKNLRTQVGMELVGIYFQSGDLDRAAATTQSLVDLNPDNPDVLYLGQLVYSELADDTLNKLTIIAPGSARMQQVIAEHLVNAGDLRGAILHYKKSLDMDPRLAGVRYEFAEAILQTAPSDPATQSQAEEELNTAVREEGDSAKVESELAHIALRRDDSKAAYEHYQRAFDLNPADVDAELGLGRFSMAQGKSEEAVKYFRMAIQNDPLNGEAHYRLGTLYRKMQMPEEAAKELKLFDEIKKTKDQVQEIYRQMNKRPPATSEEQIPDTPEQP
jgi:tetratricopeptide (TPR) repeat protein